MPKFSESPANSAFVNTLLPHAPFRPRSSGGRLVLSLLPLCFGAVIVLIRSDRLSQDSKPAPAFPRKIAAFPPVAGVENSFHFYKKETSGAEPADRADHPPGPLTAGSMESLAARDPLRAMALAAGESDQSRREELIQAVLRGWAGTDADAAANWALAQSYLDQGQAMAAVFNGSNQHPDEAVRLARRLTVQDPGNAQSFGGYLIFALGQVGKFEVAASYAASSEAAIRTDLLTAAYDKWAEIQPELAFAAALEFKTPEIQTTAVQAAIGGWARTNPQGLTEWAANIPEGSDRTLALTTALRSWIEKDPAAASEWVARTKFTPEMEAALED